MADMHENDSHKPSRRTTIAFCLIWSIVMGGGGLFGLRLIQIAASSGGPTSFPKETLAFYLAVEFLLGIGILVTKNNKTRLKATVITILILSIGTTVIAIRPALGWSADFLPVALTFEALWLGPSSLAILLL